MVDLKYGLINLGFEKLLTHPATVKNILRLFIIDVRLTLKDKILRHL